MDKTENTTSLSFITANEVVVGDFIDDAGSSPFNAYGSQRTGTVQSVSRMSKEICFKLEEGGVIRRKHSDVVIVGAK